MTRRTPAAPHRDDYLQNNRDLWDAWTRIHSASAFYDVNAFRAGRSTLKAPELEAVGSVENKEMLHLQCHFGLDTLSWARLGARTTGVDFSPEAIALARQLAADMHLDAAFHCADVSSLPPEWAERYDIVFSSYGVLPWLPDLTAWAREIERVLRKGGSFHLVEFHPLTSMLDDDGRTLRHPYFHSAAPEKYSTRGSYADPDAPLEHDAYEWAHSLADVFTALLGAGLVVRGFREYAYSPYGCFDYLEQVAEDQWKVRGAETDLPLIYSIHATK